MISEPKFAILQDENGKYLTSLELPLRYATASSYKVVLAPYEEFSSWEFPAPVRISGVNQDTQLLSASKKEVCQLHSKGIYFIDELSSLPYLSIHKRDFSPAQKIIFQNRATGDTLYSKVTFKGIEIGKATTSNDNGYAFITLLNRSPQDLYPLYVCKDSYQITDNFEQDNSFDLARHEVNVSAIGFAKGNSKYITDIYHNRTLGIVSDDTFVRELQTRI